MALRPAHEFPTPAFRVAVPTLATALVVAADALFFYWRGAVNPLVAPGATAVAGVVLTVWVVRAATGRAFALRCAGLVLALLAFQPIAWTIWLASAHPE